jgi:alkanesulfonate monooxygenase SsuD/methylene tetrahydromethanopterin reductase-like flavin-dependent oxidoreductase (luciferase family)
MQSWYFSEQSYYPAWTTNPGTTKITSPSSFVDPDVAHRLLKEYITECVLCDELGLNIMVNEHHASYTCMSISCMLTLGILAAQTKRARLLALGVPLLNRMDPVRIAEEIAYVDTISRGRLEVGLIKGTPFELFVSNAHPVTASQRYWEAHELIVAALTSRDGPISWESEHFNYRHVNVIPPCYQQPHPPMWLTTLSTSTAIEAARRDFVIGITAVARAARQSFPLYRAEYLKTHGRPAPLDRFAYLGYVAVARDEKTAIERGRKILEFVQASERILPQFINAPGMLPHADNARFLKAGETVTHRTKVLPDGTPMSNPPTPQEQIINSVLFAGTPDQVYDQIKRFYDSVGGFGHMLVQMGGTMQHDEICDSLTLYANEVMPRLKVLTGAHSLAAE